jgi:acetoin utilization deacetylase AcuC-like enzyme
MKLVFSEAYQVDLFGHVFPVEKYALIKERLLCTHAAAESDFVRAPRASLEDLARVHTRAYIDDLANLRMTHRTARSEMALTEEIVDAYVTAAGGTIEASVRALEDGVCVHLGGGYHHAYPDHAEGFCYVNDVAVAVRGVLYKGLAGRVCIIDCDLHQGNGTAFIFAQDPDVFTFSIHQEDNYPPKERSDLDIGLPDGAGDALYLERLGIIGEVLDRHGPDLAYYLAGADPFLGDKLGGLALTKNGLKKRDILVFEECKRRSIPVCPVLAGGYATDVGDNVEIHVNMVKEAMRLLG